MFLLARNIRMTEPEVSSSAESAEENVTMVDVLQEQTECDADANAVLGASDPVNCTYANVSFVKLLILFAENFTSTATYCTCTCIQFLYNFDLWPTVYPTTSKF